jgi:hypothetical protein
MPHHRPDPGAKASGKSSWTVLLPVVVILMVLTLFPVNGLFKA